MKKETVDVNIVWTSLITALVIAVAGLLANCATSGTFGSLERNQELNQKILNYEVLPDYKYYSSGGYDSPNAILGIHKDYQLVSDLWAPAQISSAQMEKWIQAIDPESYRGPVGYFAAYILDPDGKKVGIWYSIQNTTTVKFLEGKKIEVYTPNVSPRMNIKR